MKTRNGHVFGHIFYRGRLGGDFGIKPIHVLSRSKGFCDVIFLESNGRDVIICLSAGYDGAKYLLSVSGGTACVFVYA